MKEKIKIISIVIIGIIVFWGLNYFVNYSLKNKRPNELYREMKEISDKQTLISLSKKEVEEFSGKPGYKFNDETGNVYAYNAGKLDTGLFYEILLFFVI